MHGNLLSLGSSALQQPEQEMRRHLSSHTYRSGTVEYTVRSQTRRELVRNGSGTEKVFPQDHVSLAYSHPEQWRNTEDRTQQRQYPDEDSERIGHGTVRPEDQEAISGSFQCEDKEDV